MSKGFRELLRSTVVTYVVHCPEKDDYLVKVNGDLSQWQQNPSKAKQCRCFEQSLSVATTLAETKARGFWVCKVTDLGKQLQVERQVIIQPQALPAPDGTIKVEDDLPQA